MDKDKVLFVLDNISDNCGANINIALKLVERLRNDYIVHAIVFSEKIKKIDDNKRRYFDDVIEIKGGSISHLYDVREKYEWESVSVTKKILILLSHPICLMTYLDMMTCNISYIRDYIREIKKQKSVESYVAVLGVTKPYEQAKIVARINGTKRMLIQMDPHTNSYIDPKSLYWKRWLEERYVSRRMDSIFMSPVLVKDIVDHKILKNIDNIIPVEYAEINEKKSAKDKERLSTRENEVHFAFVGNFYEDIRNPRTLYELFTRLPNQYVLHIAGTGCSEITEEYKNILDTRLVVHGVLNSEEAEKLKNRADVLVSLNNSIPNMVPSKIFEYIATGKPILSICQIDDCPTIPYIRRYKNAFIVMAKDVENCEMGMIKGLVQFIESNKKLLIEKEQILDDFKNCTVGYVATIIKRKIEE